MAGLRPSGRDYLQLDGCRAGAIYSVSSLFAVHFSPQHIHLGRRRQDHNDCDFLLSSLPGGSREAVAAVLVRRRQGQLIRR
jgi:hypothetical protein